MTELDFDSDFYTETYQDLRGLRARQLRRHWRRVGAREGRYASEDAVQTALTARGVDDFDPVIYLELNPDLSKGGITTSGQALFHFATVGLDEGRPYRLDALFPAGTRLPPPAVSTSARPWPVAAPFSDRGWDLNTPVGLASAVLGRDMHGAQHDLDPWLGPLSPQDRLTSLLTCEEWLGPERALSSVPGEDFVIWVFNTIMSRPPTAAELDHFLSLVDHGSLSRSGLLGQVLPVAMNHLQESKRPLDASAGSASAGDDDPAETSSNMGFLLLGTQRMVTRDDWEERVAALEPPPPVARSTVLARPLPPGTDLLATLLCSVYRPKQFFEPFLANLRQQTIFDRLEIVVVLAAAQAEEIATLRKFSDRHANVRPIIRTDRVGIYEAWNLGVEAATTPLLTNANVDDRRRADSLEIQVKTLHEHDFVDVVYQDVLYSLESEIAWDELERIGMLTQLPPVTQRTMLGLNSPHNAPMWRASLHAELGPFDATFESAGDYEFWLRCVDAGKNFLKVRDPHVSYYVNPRGLSTRPGGAGVREANEIGRRYAHLLAYPSAPAYAARPVPGGAPMARSDRMTLGLIEHLTRLRSSDDQD